MPAYPICCPLDPNVIPAGNESASLTSLILLPNPDFVNNVLMKTMVTFV